MISFRLLCMSFLCLCFLNAPLFAQWNTILSTDDNHNSQNGSGNQIVSVAVINSKCFVALVNRPVILARARAYDDVNISDSAAANYLVGYVNATDLKGKIDRVPHGMNGIFEKWNSGSEKIQLTRAYKAIGTPDSLVYVANNDPNHHILVFKLTRDTTVSTVYRMKTGSSDIMGLAVDRNGYVYVCAINGSIANKQEIKIFKGIRMTGTKWATTYDDAPITTIDLPAGVYRGLAVSGDGRQLFVSNLGARTVTKYSGSPALGYTKAAGFSFAESINDTIPGSRFDTLGVSNWDLGRPLGMAYLNGNNLLFVATARWLGFQIRTHNGTSAYTYSKILMLNPNSGNVIDSLDIANYYFEKSDTTGENRSYTTPITGDRIHIAGYASTYDVAFDEQKTLYTQSMYGWAAEAWKYTGVLPSIVTTGVKSATATIPKGYELTANFPNPFNPVTKFDFSIPDVQFVSVKVFDLLGREIATLVNATMSPGVYSVEWNASAVPSGVYLYRIEAGMFIATKKMTLMK
ncbi:MAG TPA: T9SS type A sorting domain-containing protein [Bacteroidota bacterium]|nr:T9SS type A sorting domain-containing protein [Bacteroidota bacterium]